MSRKTDTCCLETVLGHPVPNPMPHTGWMLGFEAPGSAKHFLSLKAGCPPTKGPPNHLLRPLSGTEKTHWEPWSGNPILIQQHPGESMTGSRSTVKFSLTKLMLMCCDFKGKAVHLRDTDVDSSNEKVQQLYKRQKSLCWKLNEISQTKCWAKETRHPGVGTL